MDASRTARNIINSNPDLVVPIFLKDGKLQSYERYTISPSYAASRGIRANDLFNYIDLLSHSLELGIAFGDVDNIQILPYKDEIESQIDGKEGFVGVILTSSGALVEFVRDSELVEVADAVAKFVFDDISSEKILHISPPSTLGEEQYIRKGDCYTLDIYRTNENWFIHSTVDSNNDDIRILEESEVVSEEI